MLESKQMNRGIGQISTDPDEPSLHYYECGIVELYLSHEPEKEMLDLCISQKSQQCEEIKTTKLQAEVMLQNRLNTNSQPYNGEWIDLKPGGMITNAILNNVDIELLGSDSPFLRTRSLMELRSKRLLMMPIKREFSSLAVIEDNDRTLVTSSQSINESVETHNTAIEFQRFREVQQLTRNLMKKVSVLTIEVSESKIPFGNIASNQPETPKKTSWLKRFFLKLKGSEEMEIPSPVFEFKQLPPIRHFTLDFNIKFPFNEYSYHKKSKRTLSSQKGTMDRISIVDFGVDFDFYRQVFTGNSLAGI